MLIKRVFPQPFLTAWIPLGIQVNLKVKPPCRFLRRTLTWPQTRNLSKRACYFLLGQILACYKKAVSRPFSVFYLNEIMDYFKVMKPHFCQFDDCSGIIMTPLPYSF